MSLWMSNSFFIPGIWISDRVLCDLVHCGMHQSNRLPPPIHRTSDHRSGSHALFSLDHSSDHQESPGTLGRVLVVSRTTIREMNSFIIEILNEDYNYENCNAGNRRCYWNQMHSNYRNCTFEPGLNLRNETEWRVHWKNISSHVMSCRVVSCRGVSCRVMSCHIMPCRVMSCHVMSSHVTSFNVMSCHFHASPLSRQQSVW